MQAQMNPRELARQITATFPDIEPAVVLQDPLVIVSVPRWTAVTYTDLVADPQSTLTTICRFAGIVFDSLNVSKDYLPLSRTTITPPHASKWKKHQQEIEKPLPDLSATLGKIEKFCAFPDVQE